MTSAEPADPGGDGRPRPQYGEYATPEEQRARIQRPEATEKLEAGTTLAGRGAALPAERSPAASAPVVARSRTADRIATFALLAYGLFTVLTSVPALADYGAYIQTLFGVLGVTAEPTNAAAGRPWGIAAALVLAVGWVVVALLSWRNLRRGRLTWWIPLVGGFVCNAIASMLMLVPIMGDQALWNALMSSVG